MSTNADDPPKESEEEKVRRWRASQFLRLGFEPADVERLLDAAADYHLAERLLGIGRGHLWIVAYLK